MLMEGQADVIVVGAGLAGLNAARILRRRGLDVVVLEARERVGGRTWGVSVGESVFDFGGQWFGPKHERFSALVGELGLGVVQTYHEGRKVLDLAGRVGTYKGTIPRISPLKLIRLQLTVNRIEKLCKQVPLVAPWEVKHAALWDSMTVMDWMRCKVRNRDAIALMNSATRVIFGSDCSELSMLHFLFYLNSGGGLTQLIETHGGNQDSCIVGGAQLVSEGLAADVGTLELKAPVRRVTQDSTGVTLDTDRGAWRGRRVIIAMPLPLIDRMTFSPAMPTLRDQLTQRVGMGATIKCVATYDAPFWRGAGFTGEAVNTTGPVGVTFDNVSDTGQAALLGFVVGAPARGWAERSADERRTTVLETFARYFGPEALKAKGYLEVDWATEPFSGGGPIATFPPGTLSVFGTALRQPVGLIHWAGTETAREYTGFMEGALESGERAAEEVTAALSPGVR